MGKKAHYRLQEPNRLDGPEGPGPTGAVRPQQGGGRAGQPVEEGRGGERPDASGERQARHAVRGHSEDGHGRVGHSGGRRSLPLAFTFLMNQI